MNIAEFSITKKVITFSIMFLLLVGGLGAYNTMGRLEDPEFTIKEAVISTPYSGASAKEVEEEVTNVIEKACQSLPQIKWVRSWSYRGYSVVKPAIRDQFDKHSLPQVWDELRRKVNDVQSQLPPGSGPSLVNDDFGDVFGIFFAITGEGYSYSELFDYADMLRRELLLVQDVNKVDLYGVQNEVIYIEMSREKMAQLGITQQEIYGALSDKNMVVDAGNVQVGTDYVAINPIGGFTSEQQFKELYISSTNSGKLIRLGDVATITRGFQDPLGTILRYDGKRAVGLGISTISGGNVVTMGELLDKRLKELEPMRPVGMELNEIAYQSKAVTEAVDNFVVSLVQAVAIVIVILLIFMGLKSGLIIGFVLLLTIIGSFMFIGMTDTMLERISLGALIIALGMLVDNAIVVTEGMLIRIQSGEDKLKAAKDVVGQTIMPLLGATVIAVLAFGPIGLSDDSTGEYCGSLFTVLLISLTLSWFTAVTVTPLICYLFFKPEKKIDGTESKDPYAGMFYVRYKAFLEGCIKQRWLTIMVTAGLFVCAIIGLKYVDNSFFPNSTRPQFMIDVWLPEGTHIQETERVVSEIEEYVTSFDAITHVASTVGQGAMRFLLTYAPETPNSSYAQLLVDVDDYRVIDAISAELQSGIEERFPNVIPNVKKFLLGPGEGGKIQVRVSGTDTAAIREVASEIEAIMHADPVAKAIRNDWREKVKVVRPVLAQSQAQQAGVELSDVSNALKQAYDGTQVGVYREGRKLIPIVSRPPADERADVRNVQNLLVWSPVAQAMIPLSQVVSEVKTEFEDAVIGRRDRSMTLTIHCDAREGNPSVLLGRLMPQINALELPQGCQVVFGGEYEDSARAQGAIKKSLPMFFVLMVLIVIALFNAVTQPLIIWLCVPLGIIGVTVGLLVCGQPLGFMSILGILSLSGMLIKNSIVLLDQVNIEISEGKAPYQAVIDSAVSRMRPIMMAASTTVLGMVPLLADAFFVSMAVTIMFGLTFASVLTLVVVPVLYVTFFKIKAE